MKSTKTIEIEICDLCGNEFQPRYPEHVKTAHGWLLECCVCKKMVCSLCVRTWVRHDIICDDHDDLCCEIGSIREKADDVVLQLLRASHT